MPAIEQRRNWLVNGVIAILLAPSLACTPGMRQPRVKASSGTRVVMRAMPGEAASAAVRARGPCPADRSLSALSCPTQSAVLEVVVSAEGKVTSSRVSRSSGSQVLDAACILSSYSCLGAAGAQRAALECSLQCE